MKHLIALLAGLAVGGCIAMGVVYYNPFATHSAPTLTMADRGEQISLTYSAVAEHAMAYTNAGESRQMPVPDNVLQLWEAPIKQTEIRVTLFRDAAMQPAGLGIKFSSRSERTRLLNGQALVDSVWQVYLPERGTLLVAQTENYWTYLRDIVLPTRLDSAKAWKGDWRETITSGPGPAGTARVYGGSGSFLGLEADAIEILSVKAYSAEMGPVAVDGTLTIDVPNGSPPSQVGEVVASDAQ